MAASRKTHHAGLRRGGSGRYLGKMFSFWRPALSLALAAGVLVQTAGCTRPFYRKKADKEVGEVLAHIQRENRLVVHVLIDGQEPGAAHGADVDAQGSGIVTKQGTYQLIRQPQPIVERQFEIEFLDPGVEAYDFTFG